MWMGGLFGRVKPGEYLCTLALFDRVLLLTILNRSITPLRANFLQAQEHLTSQELKL